MDELQAAFNTAGLCALVALGLVFVFAVALVVFPPAPRRERRR